ncbi:MFS transporter [Thermaurantiacus tibetensis]|uniref:MFS transporter n=1 Tax=Thermaurantiacus tibetensis TaxID=2759035 RepID=UPI00188F6FA4|nr:MFS transporter [Thermaurantiacus tibetensis]
MKLRPIGPDSRRAGAARATLFVLVFVDLIGFGILSPLIPFYALRLGLAPEVVTLIVAAHPFAQFLAMPLLGWMSDRLGRRRILLFSMAGHAAAYLLLAVADRWEILLFARVLSGATSANLATAYAYVTDTTAAAERPRELGRISAAFGLGFMAGPLLGGLLAGGTSAADADYVRPAIIAAGLSLVSFLGIFLFLPESRPAKASGRSVCPAPRLYRRPELAGLVFVGFLVILFVAVREAILAIWAHDRHALGPPAVGLLLGASGATVVAVQFLLAGPLALRFGSFRLVQAALLLFALGWTLLLLAPGLPMMLLAMIVSGFGMALFQTNMQNLLAEVAHPEQRGRVIGLFQSGSALARFIGQGGAGTLYAGLGPSVPFLFGALAMIPATAVLAVLRSRLYGQAPGASGQPAE